jgi:ribonucleoside-diphosphate reductase alpha chain
MDKKEWKWKQPISKEIFDKKYCVHGEKDVYEVFKGIAEEISDGEEYYYQGNKTEFKEKIYKALVENKLMPGGRQLANARPNSKQRNYNNCFTIDIKDSISEIYNSLKDDALISKEGGGVGFNISNLRPQHADLSVGGTASGPVSFLKIFDKSASIIHSAGARRSAHIAILDIDHPDIEQFITAKHGDENKELTQFNLSVGMTDEFIEAVKNDSMWQLKFNGKIYKEVKARYLYDKLVENAHYYNEPGIFNIDTVNKVSNCYYIEKITTCNPCGEIPMRKTGACCLSSIKLSSFVKDPFNYDLVPVDNFDWEDFKNTIHIAIRYLNNVLVKSTYPLPKIEETVMSERRLGLGITAYADMLVKLGIKYGSKECKEFTHKLAECFRNESYRGSIVKKVENGVVTKSYFQLYDQEKFMNSEFIKKLPNDIKNDIVQYGIQNISVNSIPPTGTTSLSIGNNCSSGVEPIFALEYERTIRTTWKTDDIKKETVFNEAYLDFLELKETDPDKYNKFEKDILNNFVTTQDIKPRDYIDVIAIWQLYIDGAISNTLNLPSGTTKEEYSSLFLYAYERGLKGFTTFNVDGNMKGILNKKTDIKTDGKIARAKAPDRPIDLQCDIHVIKKNNKVYHIFVGRYEKSLYEIFADDDIDNSHNIESFKTGMIRKIEKGRYDLILQKGRMKTIVENIGKEFNPSLSVITRLLSTALRHGTPLEFLVEQLEKSNSNIDFERALIKVLKTYIVFGEDDKNVCPNCGEKLMMQEGCGTCKCGYSKCEDSAVEEPIKDEEDKEYEETKIVSLN